MKRMIDLFCGRGGWTNAFLEIGWEVIGYDLVHSPDYRGIFRQQNILELTAADLDADYICASSPCEQFSVHCMKHFHKNPPWPALGIRLFEHTQAICEASERPYIMENVRCAEKFVGRCVNHCGPFYLWGNGVPAILPPESYAVKKGLYIGTGVQMKNLTREEIRAARKKARIEHGQWASSNSQERRDQTSHFATIPPALASAIARFAESL